MNRSILFCAIVGAPVLAGVTAKADAAADLTGTWEGRVTCDCFGGERVKTSPGRAPVTQLVISQMVNTDPHGPTQPLICLRLGGAGGFPPSHSGRLIESAAHPGSGELVLVGLGVDPTLSAPGVDGPFDLGRGTFALGNKDSLDASITKVVWAVDPGITLAICTCTWRFDRVNTLDPGLNCPS